MLRELVGVDSVEVEADGLTPGAKYNVCAVKVDSTRQLIADFRAGEKGKDSVSHQPKFFDIGFTRVEVERAARTGNLSAMKRRALVPVACARRFVIRMALNYFFTARDSGQARRHLS